MCYGFGLVGEIFLVDEIVEREIGGVGEFFGCVLRADESGDGGERGRRRGDVGNVFFDVSIDGRWV